MLKTPKRWTLEEDEALRQEVERQQGGMAIDTETTSVLKHD